jgi:VanZ family protein
VRIPLQPQALKAWLTVALWAVLIWALSGDDFSAGATSRFLGPLVRWLFPSISAGAMEWIHAAVRKGAHLLEYGVLALLALRALRLSAETAWLRSAALALALAVSVAVADEAHQAREAQRTGSPIDVAVDGAGGLVALAVAGVWRRRSTGSRA